MASHKALEPEVGRDTDSYRPHSLADRDNPHTTEHRWIYVYSLIQMTNRGKCGKSIELVTPYSLKDEPVLISGKSLACRQTKKIYMLGVLN